MFWTGRFHLFECNTLISNDCSNKILLLMLLFFMTAQKNKNINLCIDDIFLELAKNYFI